MIRKKTYSEKIVLPENIKNKTDIHAKREYPYECCGILLGNRLLKGNICIYDCAEAKNEVCARDAKRHYSIGPLKLYESELKYQERNLEIIGFYHSHPDAPAIPSDEDTAEMIPGLLYLITEVRNGICAARRIWRKDFGSEYADEFSIGKEKGE